VVVLDAVSGRAAERGLDRRRVARPRPRARQRLRVAFTVDGARELAPLVVLVRRLEAERIDRTRQKTAEPVFEADRAARWIGDFGEPAVGIDRELRRMPIRP